MPDTVPEAALAGLLGAGKSKLDGGGASKLPFDPPADGGGASSEPPVDGAAPPSRFFFGCEKSIS